VDHVYGESDRVYVESEHAYSRPEHGYAEAEHAYVKLDHAYADGNRVHMEFEGRVVEGERPDGEHRQRYTVRSAFAAAG
jgi:hypothetical protein